MKHKSSFLLLPLLFMIIVSCDESYTPKPKGYFKIDLPEKKYQPYSSEECPYTFEYPVYSKIAKDSAYFNTKPENNCWINIEIPSLQGVIHMSYKEVNDKNSIGKLIEDMHTLTYKHTIKAEYIDAKQIATKNKVYGLLYEVGGDAASPVQFFLTDSNNHFIRGALYFNTEANADSLAPATNFVKEDIDHLINTFQWKK